MGEAPYAKGIYSHRLSWVSVWLKTNKQKKSGAQSHDVPGLKLEGNWANVTKKSNMGKGCN